MKKNIITKWKRVFFNGILLVFLMVGVYLCIFLWAISGDLVRMWNEKPGTPYDKSLLRDSIALNLSEHDLEGLTKTAGLYAKEWMDTELLRHFELRFNESGKRTEGCRFYYRLEDIGDLRGSLVIRCVWDGRLWKIVSADAKYFDPVGDGEMKIISYSRIRKTLDALRDRGDSVLDAQVYKIAMSWGVVWITPMRLIDGEYYVEKDIVYTINEEGGKLRLEKAETEGGGG